MLVIKTLEVSTIKCLLPISFIGILLQQNKSQWHMVYWLKGIYNKNIRDENIFTLKKRSDAS